MDLWECLPSYICSWTPDKLFMVSVGRKFIFSFAFILIREMSVKIFSVYLNPPKEMLYQKVSFISNKYSEERKSLVYCVNTLYPSFNVDSTVSPLKVFHIKIEDCSNVYLHWMVQNKPLSDLQTGRKPYYMSGGFFFPVVSMRDSCKDLVLYSSLAVPGYGDKVACIIPRKGKKKR